MRATCIIELSRSFERLEADPNFGPSQPSVPGTIPETSTIQFNLPDHVGQEAQEACALDRLGELALLLRRDCRDPARHDLAALGYVALKELGVFVVDLRRIGAGERAGLAPPEERPPSATAAAATETTAVTIARRVTECHDRYSSVAASIGCRSPRSSSRSRRGGRSPRSPPNPPPPPKRSPRSPKRPPPRSSRSRSRSTLRIIADGPSSSSSTRTVR